MAELAAAEVYATAGRTTKTGQAWRTVLGWLGFLFQVLLQILRGTPSWAQVLSFVGLRHPLLSSSSSSSPAFKPLPAEAPTDTPPPPPPEVLDKLTVVLDLDETLVCAYETSSLPTIVHSQAIEAGLKCFELECISMDKEVEGKQKVNHVTVFERPGLQEFLRQINEFANLVLFTAGLEGYARPLVDRIDIENRFSLRLYRPATVSTMILSFPRALNPSLQFRRFSSSSSQSSQMDFFSKALKVVKLKPIDATEASFAEFGQVVSASPDGELYGPHDAQLELHRGTPRLYIMHLEDRELKFSSITHHAKVTQCLGSVGGQEWYLGVAKASILDESNANKDDGRKLTQSTYGHYYIPPHPDDVCVFRIAGPKFLKLNVGTWHAGPLFKTRTMDFYNLELSNTNVVDHTTHNFLRNDGVIFLVEED